MRSQPKYCCPLCNEPLLGDPQGLSCINNHRFDFAKEGYVNLLPVQHKRSKIPGDSKTMVAARSAFLATDAYQFLRTAIIDVLGAQLNPEAVILDAGCGEGYYTHAVAQSLEESSVYGIDIAKTAIKTAAKRKSVSADAIFAVASNVNLPFAANFFDAVYKVFAPVDYAELTRVLKTQGLLLSIVPGPDHLLELKKLIYQQVKQHENEACPEGFERLDSQRLTKKIKLTTQADINNLAQMTPFAWKFTATTLAQLLERNSFDVTFDFTINGYRSLK